MQGVYETTVVSLREYANVSAVVAAGRSLYGPDNPIAILFRNTLHDRAAIAVMQAYAAYGLARKGQCPPETALVKRVESIALINESLSDRRNASQDAFLATILGTIAVDVEPASSMLRAQHQDEGRVHIVGLVQLVQARGGPRVLPSWLQCFYHWSVLFRLCLLFHADF
jgi:hypothetical protein